MNFRNSYTQRVPQGENYQDVIDRFEALSLIIPSIRRMILL